MKKETSIFNWSAIPLISDNVVFRDDENGMLIFQIHTDEMYFVSNETYAIIQKCNGANTCDDIVSGIMGQSKMTPTEIQSFFIKFIENLIERKIIELL